MIINKMISLLTNEHIINWCFCVYFLDNDNYLFLLCSFSNNVRECIGVLYNIILFLNITFNVHDTAIARKRQLTPIPNDEEFLRTGW